MKALLLALAVFLSGCSIDSWVKCQIGDGPCGQENWMLWENSRSAWGIDDRRYAPVKNWKVSAIPDMGKIKIIEGENHE